MKNLIFLIAIILLISSCSKDEMNTEPDTIQTIVPTIKNGDTGSAVVNLQNALLKLLDLGIFKTYNAPDSPTIEYLQQLTLQFKVESTNQIYGEATRKLIQIFQIQNGLGASLNGVVEATTAAKLNALLLTLGVIG